MNSLGELEEVVMRYPPARKPDLLAHDGFPRHQHFVKTPQVSLIRGKV